MKFSRFILFVYIINLPYGLTNINLNKALQNVSTFTETKLVNNNNNRINEYQLKTDKYIYEVENFQYFDNEWKFLPNRTITKIIPELILNLYNSIEENKSQEFVYQSSTVKCFQAASHKIIDSGVILRFNLTGIQAHEEIIRLEFNIYKHPLRSRYFQNSTLIRLYKLLSTNDENITNTHELLGASYVFPYFEGWQVFNLERLIDKWKPLNLTIDLFISFTDVWNRLLDTKNLNYNISDSYLLMYMAVTSQKHPTNIPKTSLFKNNIEKVVNTSILQPPDQSCALVEFHVNFKKDSFTNFILRPDELKLNKCSGVCRLNETLNISNHAKLLQILYGNYSEKLSFCVPDSYAPAVIMFVDPYNNIVIRNYRNMIVTRCNCR